MRASKVFLIHHQGMGDMLVCLGLYRFLASQTNKLILPVRNPYFKTIKHLLSDLTNVKILKIPFMGDSGQNRRFELTIMRVLALCHRILGASILKLGYLGSNFLRPESLMRYDENFYFQAGVSFEHRWASFRFPRRASQEEGLFKRLVPTSGEYLFLHEDKSRGFIIDRSLLPKGVVVVEPLEPSENFFVTDYTKIILGASQIHVIESSFGALVEGLAPTGKLFAHRYARPEARNNWQQEFTYKSNWHIFN